MSLELAKNSGHNNPAMNILIIGGSGFVSGTIARIGLARGDDVWTVTRGQRELPKGVHPLIADRKNRDDFERAINATDVSWDLAVDCIGFLREEARQDIDIVMKRCAHLIFISTDFVYDPERRSFPQGEAADSYTKEGYGFHKREAELELETAPSKSWTVLRPCHIYGPGSQLGCLPLHSRDTEIIAKIQAGETLRLVGGGYFLQEPLFVEDLAGIVFSLGGNRNAYGRILNVSGPDCIESREFYRIVARVLGTGIEIEEVPVAASLASHPEWKPFLCHRFYDKSRLLELTEPPSTYIEEGLRRHVEWLTAVDAPE